MERQRRNGYRGKAALRGKGRVWLLLAAVCLAGSGVCFFIPGIRFSACLLLGLSGLSAAAAFLEYLSAYFRTAKVCYVIFLVGLCASLILFFGVEGLLVGAGRQIDEAGSPDAVIVLGAGVNGDKPSLVLRSRIDAAERYMEQHPDIPVILSGGQGAGEKITEAEAMRRAMLTDGVCAGRLHLEEASTTTAENFENSRALLERLGVDPKSATVAVVTNDFHVYRARRIARQAGLQTASVSAGLPWWLSVNYYAREFFALGKMVLVRRF